MRKLPILLLTASLIAPVGLVVVRAGATSRPAHPSYALKKAAHCKPAYRKVTAHHKVKGKSVRFIQCQYVPPALKVVPGGSTGSSVGSTSTHTGSARANVDPTYVQDPVNPLKVTFTYFAGVAGEPLPNGVLSLYWGPTTQSKTLACSENVGGTNGTESDPLLCTITFPAYGTEYVTTVYTSGTSSATQTDQENIQNPNPVVTTTTTTLAPHTTTVVQVTSSTITQGHHFVLSATVTDQNGAAVPVSPSQLTFQVVQSPGQYQSVFLSSSAASGNSCSFEAIAASSNRIAFGGNGGVVTTCSFSGGGDYGPDSGSYAVVAVYSGAGSVPGSTSGNVSISVP